MTRKKWELDRRTFLKASGVSLALPFLEAMLPSVTRASATKMQRLMFIYLPNGYMKKSDSDDYSDATLNVLNTMKSDLTMIKNVSTFLTNEVADHNMATIAYLMGFSHPDQAFEITDGNSASYQAPFRPEVMERTMDQRIADYNRGSLESARVLSYYGEKFPEGTFGNVGNANFILNLSWEGPNKHAYTHMSPVELFEALFASAPPVSTAPSAYPDQTTRRGVLHYVLDQINATKRKVGRDDQIRLDEYLTGVEELERNISANTPQIVSCQAPARPTDFDSAVKRLDLFFEMAFRAYQCDLTRVFTLVPDMEGADYPQDFVPGIENKGFGWHTLSHGEGSGGADSSFADCIKIEAWYMNKIVQFAQRLKNTIQPSGQSLLDESCLVFGHGLVSHALRQGSAHHYDPMRVNYLGSANGALRTGIEVDAGGANISNLWLTLMQAFGVPDTRFSRSTGIVPGLVR